MTLSDVYSSLGFLRRGYPAFVMKTTLDFLHFDGIYDKLIHLEYIPLSHRTRLPATVLSSAGWMLSGLDDLKGLKV